MMEPVGGGGLYGAFIMPYGDVSLRSGVMIQDMGENLQNFTKLLPNIPFSTSSHCRFAEVTQSSRDQWVPLDRHTESHKHNRQTQRGTEKEGDEVSFKVCVCVCLHVHVHVCLYTYMHMFMYVCACLPANVHV